MQAQLVPNSKGRKQFTIGILYHCNLQGERMGVRRDELMNATREVAHNLCSFESVVQRQVARAHGMCSRPIICAHHSRAAGGPAVLRKRCVTYRTSHTGQ